MGIPGLLSWLNRKYLGFAVDCVEKKPVFEAGQLKFADSSLPNPNGVEFDNLYLDMNSIIHPCTRPEELPAPESEEQMMVAVCEYVDRLFRIVRPRKLLYMAVDGVAPRSLMNHQRARRFLSSKETKQHNDEVSRIRAELLARGVSLPPEKAQVVAGGMSPGTALMDRLTNCLHHYIHDRMNNNMGWQGVQVIFSDVYVPGKCDQKIFDFIRKQRAEPGYDPNTQHVICGGDAELILLALATHEPNFSIIREEFRNYCKPKFCHICERQGHEMKSCPGTVEMETDPTILVNPERFVFLKLAVLREHLERELQIPRHQFPEYEFERALDDWILLCCFVGNDVLPPLPSLVVREGAITKLVQFYKKCVSETKGWVTDSGEIDLHRLQRIIQDLGREELKIFQERRTNDRSYKDWQKKLTETWRAVSCDDGEEAEKEEEYDQVRLWEEGFKGRYYERKFRVAPDNVDFRRGVTSEYVRGLCWVLRYYYQGCASWKWYFPYHYAPFASDFVNISGLSTKFEKGTQPLEPLQQLMLVLPPSSWSLMPASWAQLMTEPASPIHDFYPVDIRVDMNGKKFTYYGGVSVLIPFVHEDRLIQTLEPCYEHLTDSERQRNIRGHARLYVSGHKSREYIRELYEDAGFELQSVIDKEQRYPYRCDGVRGEIMLREDYVCIGGELPPPLPGLLPVLDNSCLCVSFLHPHYSEDFVFPARRLKDAQDPPRVLKPDSGVDENRNYRPRGSTEFQRREFESANRAQSNHSYNNQRQSNHGYNNQRFTNQRYNDERYNSEGNRSVFGRTGSQSSYKRAGSSGQNRGYNSTGQGYQQDGRRNY